MNVKALRTKRQLNQTALAKRVGVSQAYIAMLEKGAHVNPTLRLLTKLAKALKVHGGGVGGLIEGRKWTFLEECSQD